MDRGHRGAAANTPQRLSTRQLLPYTPRLQGLPLTRREGTSPAANPRPVIVAPEVPTATSIDSTELPDYTEAPGSKIPVYTFAFAPDATSAPDIGQTEEIEGELAKSPNELADKYFFCQLRKESVVFFIPLIPIIWIFVQDNGGGVSKLVKACSHF